MFDAATELIRILANSGVGPWITDDMGRSLHVEEWADLFVGQLAETIDSEAADEVARLEALRELLAEKPRKSIAVAKIHEIIDI